jgi:hypothetical protein
LPALGTVLGWFAVSALLPGCGNVLYAYRANSASIKLEEARQAGAERTALYEYTLAREHLTKAMSEASEADYGDASELAQLASDFALQAFEKARLRMKVSSAATPTSNAPLAASASVTTEFKSSTESGSPSSASQAGTK